MSATELLALLLSPIRVGEGTPTLPAQVLSRFPSLAGAVLAACELGRRVYAAPPAWRHVALGNRHLLGDLY